MQVPRARIVPQAIPRLTYGARRRTGETPEIREALEKPRIVLRHAAHLRLLQHEFGDQHAVRIAGAAPRQIARGAGPPGQQAAGERRFHVPPKFRLHPFFSFPHFVLTPCPALGTFVLTPCPPLGAFVLTPCPPLGTFVLTPLSPSPFRRGGTRNSPFVPPLHVVETGSGGEDVVAERATRGEDHDAERGTRGENHDVKRGTGGSDEVWGWTYGPWVPKIQPMSNGAALTLDPLRLIARWSLRTADHAGRFSFLIADMFRGLAEWRVWVPRTLEQATAVGYGSLFIVLLVAGFAGAVTSLQTGYQFTGTLPLYYAGAVISESMILELGPVLTALILAGRIGARYAAELGTMRVTEQIDALESLGRSPVSHLLIPRVIAGLLVIPALTMFANATGIIVGYLTAKGSLGLTYGDFEYGARYFFRPLDLWYSAIKSVCFAGALTTIPCYLGFNTQQGAEGVGRATTTAVVSASVAILMLDALTTKLLLVAK